MYTAFQIVVLLLNSVVLFTTAFPLTGPQAVAIHQTKRQSTTYIEERPWQVSRIFVFTANENSAQSSSVSFNVVDTNVNLVLNTTCFATFPSGQSPDTGDNWFPCEDEHFRFKYTGGQVGIQRTWDDPNAGASGPAGTGGFGDDSEFCIGYEQTTLHEEEISSGVVERQRCLDVYCKYECC